MTQISKRWDLDFTLSFPVGLSLGHFLLSLRTSIPNLYAGDDNPEVRDYDCRVAKSNPET